MKGVKKIFNFWIFVRRYLQIWLILCGWAGGWQDGIFSWLWPKFLQFLPQKEVEVWKKMIKIYFCNQHLEGQARLY